MRIHYLLAGLFLLTLIQPANATCTTGLYNLPCINIWLNPDHIAGTGAPASTTGIMVTTSFDPNPTETTPCTNCYLQVQDCNGSLAECNDGSTNTPDWNGIDGNISLDKFEGDLYCANDCKRSGVTEDTAFLARVTTIRVGSRYFRACWYNAGSLVNCSGEVVRIHTYPGSLVVEPGTTGCHPSVNGGKKILGMPTCTFWNNNKPGETKVPFVYYLNGDLNLVDCDFTLEGVSIDYNNLRLDKPPTIYLTGTSTFTFNNYVIADNFPFTDLGGPTYIDGNFITFLRGSPR